MCERHTSLHLKQLTETHWHGQTVEKRGREKEKYSATETSDTISIDAVSCVRWNQVEKCRPVECRGTNEYIQMYLQCSFCYFSTVFVGNINA